MRLLNGMRAAEPRLPTHLSAGRALHRNDIHSSTPMSQGRQQGDRHVSGLQNALPFGIWSISSGTPAGVCLLFKMCYMFVAAAFYCDLGSEAENVLECIYLPTVVDIGLWSTLMSLIHCKSR